VSGERLYQVTGIETIYVRQRSIYGIVAYPLGLRLFLEDGRKFEMYHVSVDVIEALEMMKRGDPPPRRQSLFTFLAYNENFRDIIGQYLEKVVIDEFDEKTGLYTATVHFHSDGLRLTIKMIPSHAIFLAMLAEKPIYVAESLVVLYMEQMEEQMLEEEGVEDYMYDDEDYDEEGEPGGF